MGLLSKEAENLVLFERVEILDNLDQLFVSVKGHDKWIDPSKQWLTAKRRSASGRDVVANESVLDVLTRFVDSDLCTSLVSSSFPSEGQGKRLALGLA